MVVNLVEDLDAEKGIVYKTEGIHYVYNQEYNRYVSVSSVHTGGEFSLWSEAYVANGIVVLIYVAQGGFPCFL